MLYGVAVITGAIRAKDRFGDSGPPWELIKEFEVSAEHIAAKAIELMGVEKSRASETLEVHLAESKYKSGAPQWARLPRSHASRLSRQTSTHRSVLRSLRGGLEIWITRLPQNKSSNVRSQAFALRPTRTKSVTFVEVNP